MELRRVRRRRSTGSQPDRALRLLDRLEGAPDRVLADNLLHPQDFWRRRVAAPRRDMRSACGRRAWKASPCRERPACPARSAPTLDGEQNPRLLTVLAQSRHQEGMIEIVEKRPEVGVQDDVRFSCRRSRRPSRRAHRAPRVRAGIRTRIRGSPPREKRVRQRNRRSLDDPRVEPEDKPCLRQAATASGRSRPSGLGMYGPPRPVGCSMERRRASPRGRPRGRPRGSPRTPSRSQPSAPASLVLVAFGEGGGEQVDGEMAEERSERLLLPSPCFLRPAACRTRVERL